MVNGFHGNTELNFNVVYHDKNMPRLCHVGGYNKSDFIDLYCVSATVTHTDGTVEEFKDNWEEFSYEQGAIVFVSFGISIELNDENGKQYTALVYPRSSLFKKTGLFMTNSTGIIDNSYNSNKDVWMGMMLAMKSGTVKKYMRLAQFTIVEKTPLLKFTEVENLNNEERGRYGSTGE